MDQWVKKGWHEWVRGLLLLQVLSAHFHSLQPLEKKQVAWSVGEWEMWVEISVWMWFEGPLDHEWHLGTAACQETDRRLEEGICMDHVHRKGDNGHFIQTSLEGFSQKPPISNCEFVGKQTEWMLRVSAQAFATHPGWPGVSAQGDWCPDCVHPWTDTCSQAPTNMPALQAACRSNSLVGCGCLRQKESNIY